MPSSVLHYPIDIIAQCVRWYLAYALSLRNLEEMMAERGVIVDHSTLHRWVIRLVPLLDKAFRRHKRTVGRRWRMDETDIKIKGQWKYLYRAVDTGVVSGNPPKFCGLAMTTSTPQSWRPDRALSLH
ncbi:Transposase IS66 family [Serratia fonticola]|uniref:Transposase IS66 family n=1 Tax=Serratia fonticola TaxID=47917 RepID=A0A4U9W3V4_SERFO|nr:Transposase IS66 family [Serratia fonticola]